MYKRQITDLEQTEVDNIMVSVYLVNVKLHLSLYPRIPLISNVMVSKSVKNENKDRTLQLISFKN